MWIMGRTLDELFHDLANRVNAIGGLSWILLTNVKDEKPLYPLLSEAERAGNLVREMQAHLMCGRRR